MSNNVGMKAPLDTSHGRAPEPRAWVLNSEALWRRAHRIAAANVGMDAGDVYHALRCLALSPQERLRRGLGRGRLRAQRR